MPNLDLSFVLWNLDKVIYQNGKIYKNILEIGMNFGVYYHPGCIETVTVETGYLGIRNSVQSRRTINSPWKYYWATWLLRKM